MKFSFSKKAIKVLFFLLAANTFLLFDVYLPGKLNSLRLYYLYRPSAWLALGIISYMIMFFIPEMRIKPRSHVILTGAAAGILEVILSFAAGIFVGFGKSPYAHDLNTLLTNVFYFSSFIIGIEFVRTLLLSDIKKTNFAEVILATSLFFTIINISPSSYRFSDGLALLNFFANRFVPLFAVNLFAGVLAYASGFQASLTYRLIISAFEWLSPVLPDLPWYLNTGINTLVPLIFIIYVAQTNSDLFEEDIENKKSSSAWSWLAVGIISVIIFWFFSGIFPYKPIVVAGRSMTPTLNLGDIVIYHSVPPEKIQTGDIVVFRSPAGLVIHRVIKIEKSGKNIYFTTKGDANRVPDHDILLPENIRGKVIFRIPYIGWLAIALKNAIF